MLDRNEEAKFAELRDKCRELRVPSPPEIMIGLKVTEGGRLTFDDIQRGHSWTRNFYNKLLATMLDVQGYAGASFGAGLASAKNTDATINATTNMGLVRVYSNTPTMAGRGLVDTGADSLFGVVIGTGNTAFSPEHHKLVTQITHGTGAGQLSHVGMSNPTVSYDAGTHIWSVTIPRVFNNNSGGAITVKETGLYDYLYWYASNSVAYYMVERSVLSPEVAVANGAQLTVTYTATVDFSAID